LQRPFDRKVGTSLDPLETLVLTAICKFTRAKRIIEIGTFDGNTALNLAVNSPPDAHVVTVDLPPEWDGHLALEVSSAHRNVTDRTVVGQQFRHTQWESKIRQVYADSATLEWGTLGGPFDLAFIDGCHAYNYIKRDTENALQHVRAEGWIVWHDYGLLDDATTYLDELSQRLRIAAIDGTRFAVAQPGDTR